MRQILTDALCKKRPPAAGRLEIADLRQPGLEFRITTDGARTFSFRFRHPHSRKTLRITLGAYPSVSLEAARKRARKMAEQVGAGESPIDVKRAEREAAATRTFAAVAGRYMKEYAERHKRPRSIEEDRRNLAVHILPEWSKRDFRSIRRADIIDLVEPIIDSGRNATGNRVQTLVSGILSFAVEAGLIESNPASRLKKRGKEEPRRRVLSDAELATFWHGIVQPPVSRAVGLALHLCLLTATRANEVAGARKSEFRSLDDVKRASWLIPGERVKNKRDHLVPLSPLAVETITAAIELTSDDDEFLFPARFGLDGPIDRHSLSGAMARFAKALKGERAISWRKDKPTPHDLRRSANTRLAGAGIPKEIRDHVLNHKQGDPESKHYNLYDFEPEKRDALCKWADEIATITGVRS
jgi:integrase